MRKINILIILLIISPNLMAEKKPGWNENEVINGAKSCAVEYVNSARGGYYAQAKEAGNNNPKPFPEAQFQESAFKWCSCLMNKASEKWPIDEFRNNMSHFNSLLAASYYGEICQPTGIIKQIFDKSAARQNSVEAAHNKASKRTK